MQAAVDSFLSGFPHLILHLGVTLSLLIAGAWIYTKITPHDELKLIRENNVAAAISYSGAILGLAIPLGVCLATSFSVWDILIWGFVTLLLQLLALRLIDGLLSGLSERIERGEIAPATLLAAAKLSVAAINAGAIAG